MDYFASFIHTLGIFLTLSIFNDYFAITHMYRDEAMNLFLLGGLVIRVDEFLCFETAVYSMRENCCIYRTDNVTKMKWLDLS